jgi:hypothetical protein
VLEKGGSIIIVLAPRLLVLNLTLLTARPSSGRWKSPKKRL